MMSWFWVCQTQDFTVASCALGFILAEIQLISQNWTYSQKWKLEHNVLHASGLITHTPLLYG